MPKNTINDFKVGTIFRCGCRNPCLFQKQKVLEVDTANETVTHVCLEGYKTGVKAVWGIFENRLDDAIILSQPKPISYRQIFRESLQKP